MLYVISKSTTGNGNRASWDVVSSNFLCFYLEYCCRNCNSNTWRLLLNNPSSSPVLSWHYYLIINRLMIVWIFMRPRGEVCMCVLLQYNRVAVIPFPCPCKQQNESWWYHMLSAECVRVTDYKNCSLNIMNSTLLRKIGSFGPETY